MLACSYYGVAAIGDPFYKIEFGLAFNVLGSLSPVSIMISGALFVSMSLILITHSLSAILDSFLDDEVGVGVWLLSLISI